MWVVVVVAINVGEVKRRGAYIITGAPIMALNVFPAEALRNITRGGSGPDKMADRYRDQACNLNN